MQITIQIRELNYGDAAVLAMPLLEEKLGQTEGSIGKILSAVTKLPASLILSLFDAISQEEKNEIVAMVVEENKEKILEAAGKITRENDIGITIQDFFVTKDLTICAVVSEIDYGGLIMKLLPMVEDKIASGDNKLAPLLSKLAKASVSQARNILNLVPQNTKDSAVVYLLNQNRDHIVTSIEDAAAKAGVGLQIGALTAEV